MKRMVETHPLYIPIPNSPTRGCRAESVISINFSETEKREYLLAHPDTNAGKLEENKGCVAGWVDMENIYDYLPGIKARPGITVDSGSGHAALWQSAFI